LTCEHWNTPAVPVNAGDDFVLSIAQADIVHVGTHDMGCLSRFGGCQENDGEQEDYERFHVFQAWDVRFHKVGFAGLDDCHLNIVAQPVAFFLNA
jgi:hypothetical protein